MKKIPYDTLNDLQQFIVGWAGDKDGGCPIEVILDFSKKSGYNKEDVLKEIENMIKNGTIVKSAYSTQLHYPYWRPNESMQVCKENRKGRWSYIEKEEEYDDLIETEGILAILPDGTEKGYSTILEASIDLKVKDRLIAKILRGWETSEIIFKYGVIKRERKVGTRTITEKFWQKPPRYKKLSIIHQHQNLTE